MIVSKTDNIIIFRKGFQSITRTGRGAEEVGETSTSIRNSRDAKSL